MCTTFTNKDCELMAKIAKPLQEFMRLKCNKDSVIVVDLETVRLMDGVMCARKPLNTVRNDCHV